MQKFSIAIHGGAGTILKANMTEALESAYRDGLQSALDIGYQILKDGGSAMDAVEAATVKLEDYELFNAGKGSVFNHIGGHEMDASIMDGRTLQAGAVAGVKNIRNPVLLAKQIMLHSGHVFLMGSGAYEFAMKHEIKTEPDVYFFSQSRYDQWCEIRDTDLVQLDHTGENVVLHKEQKHGTVGAVACDRNGNLAAATSTGGMTNKRYGRIGDTPMIGAGNYANNKTCAISCTGVGEVFIKAVAAYDVSCLMEYKGMSLHDACHEVIINKLLPMEGDGGLIGVDATGTAALVFNSAGMYRGLRDSDGENYVAIYAD